MKIYFACPQCGQKYTAPAKLANRELICRRCRLRMVIPDYNASEQSMPESEDSVEVELPEAQGTPGDNPFDFTSPAARNPEPKPLPSTQQLAPQRPLEAIPEVQPVTPPKPSLVQILLDPRSIQLLLISGGLLLVTGIVTLLYVNDWLTPLALAVILGLANVALLGAGLYLRRWTEYKTAGLAVTLLACAVLPLNLWYYHANNLLTFGGHLWLPALVISGLYLVSALVLRDKRFVYVFLGGVTLTGLLVLADLPPSPQKFWEIAYPASWLVILGMAALHAERAFAPEAGPFSREEFGKAFFHSGLLLIGSGVILLLIAYIGGDWLYEPLFKPI